MSFNWLTHENIIYSENTVEYLDKYVKVASFDLDHTLIKPKGKRTHPKDKEDFEFVFPNIGDVLNKYNDLGFSIIIFSNQSSLNIKPDKKKNSFIKNTKIKRFSISKIQYSCTSVYFKFK